jgi:hypothetical protein
MVVPPSTSSQHAAPISQSSQQPPTILKVEGAKADATMPSEMEVDGVQAVQPPKEPPSLPSQLPPAVLMKVTNLEQVRKHGFDWCALKRSKLCAIVRCTADIERHRYHWPASNYSKDILR